MNLPNEGIPNIYPKVHRIMQNGGTPTQPRIGGISIEKERKRRIRGTLKPTYKYKVYPGLKTFKFWVYRRKYGNKVHQKIQNAGTPNR